MRYAPLRLRNVDRVVLPVAVLFSLCTWDGAGDTVERCCVWGVVFEGEASTAEEVREVVLVDRSRRTVGACSESVYGLE